MGKEQLPEKMQQENKLAKEVDYVLCHMFDSIEKIENRLSKLESINYQNRRKS